MVTIEKKDYELIGILSDEESCLHNFEDQSGYICDAINETADSYIPIYTSDIWKDASSIQEYIEEAIANGIAGIEGNNIDLIKIFQAGYYQYYTQSLYNNLDTLVFNFIVDKVNNYLNELTEEQINGLDLDQIEEELEETTDDYDNNNTFDDLEDTAKDFIQRIKNGEFNIVE